jgi:hypothetical protein
MCSTGLSEWFFKDERIQEIMTHPSMDLVHKQVLFNLYALQADGHLDGYQDLLPVYLGKPWPECDRILDKIEEMGLIRRSGEGLFLIYEPERSAALSSCMCGH